MTDTPTAPSLAPLSTIRRLHSGMTVGNYHSMHLLGALFPLGAGVVLFGWRAAVVVLGVVLSAAAFQMIWRQVGARGRQLSYSNTLWLAVLLSMMLPARLATSLHTLPVVQPPWPLLLVAGGVLAMTVWLVGGLASLPIHPAIITVLLMLLAFGTYLEPGWVLDKNHLIAGDVVAGPAPGSGGVSADPWLHRSAGSRFQSFWGEPPAKALTDYTTGRLRPDRGQMPLHALLRDRMPPLEDLTIGGQPAPLGQGSAIAVIIGGLFLLYRGLIDFRIPLFVVVFAFVALLVLPVPTVIREDGAHFRWLAMRSPDVRWETAVTFVNYEILASPILFVGFFLATAAPVRPLSRRARVLYASILGVACAITQLYISDAYGPYLALLLVGLLSPVLDRWFKPRPLV